MWISTDSRTDVDEITEQVNLYKDRYPEAIVAYREEDCGEWIDYDDEDRVGEGYYSEYYLYYLTLIFRNAADEAEFILRETV